MSAAPTWAAELFRPTLSPAISDDDGMPLVWSVDGDASTARISEQFKANAGTYEARYAASAHFEGLYGQAIAQAGLSIPAGATVLDMGAGSGANSVVPSLSLLTGARYIATDLSGELLTLMADYAQRNGLTDRILAVKMDAMSDLVHEGAFDLVTGSAILHHLERPQSGLSAAARALKPGGHAIFMEPFHGYALMRLAFERILAEADLRNEPLDPAAARAMQAMVTDIAARTDPDTASPAFAALDDKWLFSRESIERMAEEAGFASVRIVPHNDRPHMFRNGGAVMIRLATGEEPDLPAWAKAILDSFDVAITAVGKRTMMLEGSIVLTR